MVPQPFLAMRGSPFRVRSFVQALVNCGYTVDLLVFPFGEDVAIPGVTLYRTLRLPTIKNIPIGPSWAKFFSDICLSFSALKLASRKKYTVIHGVEECGITATLLGLATGTPYIFDMHSCMSEQLCCRKFPGAKAIGAVTALIERFCIKRAAGVITVSDELTAQANKIQPNIPCLTIQDTALGTEQQTDNKLLSDLKSSLGINDRKTIVYTGNFDPCQGLDLLFNGFAKLIANLPQGHSAPVLVIVGGGDEELENKKKYLALCSSLGLTEHVIFAGSRPANQMRTFMALADILVTPRVTGRNTPLKVYCYMAAGRPIVATNILSNSQVLSEDCAYLSNPEPVQLAKTLLRALDDNVNDRPKQQAKIERALQLFQANYSREQFEKKIGYFYRTITEKQTTQLVDISSRTLELDEQVQSAANKINVG